MQSYSDLETMPLAELMWQAEQLTVGGHGTRISYSRKVFIPLTQLCRDVCGYCTFAKAPRKLRSPYLTIEECVAIARAGSDVGCKEALFTLGDQPELRYSSARAALDALGYATTLDYLAAAAAAVQRETGLLPHLNAGVLSADACARLRRVSVSMGLMLESTADRLSARGGPHWNSPDKHPARRLETLNAAGEQSVPFTTGLLIGIGETRRERIDTLLAIRETHQRYGHIQEVIIQNFRAKPRTVMAFSPEPTIEDHQWTIAAARIILGAEMSLQSPPNLQPDGLDALIRAGINDWGGVSPLTPDHVNPERPWPELTALQTQTAKAGRVLTERLAIGPRYVQRRSRWVDVLLQNAVLQKSDADGLARTDNWAAGAGHEACFATPATPRSPSRVQHPRRLLDGTEMLELFAARGDQVHAVLAAADELRARVNGDTVTYVVNRNINYTNICTYRCGFCAFSKGRSTRDLRGPAYRLEVEEIARRAVEAREAGATEVCLQGGIHPHFTGDTYLDIVAAVKAAAPDIHIHAFSPLEVTHGAKTLGLSLDSYLKKLKAAGLSTLPGTAAEILDDEIRAKICPDKINTDEWLAVMRAAHGAGLRTTATIMFGHVEGPQHWVRHLLRIRDLQKSTGGFTEFVPLPFVHMEAPLWRKGNARPGPTLREALLMHAVARLSLHPLIPNVQASWVKMGPSGAALCLKSGANDLGGTLMNESITRAAGGVNGQELNSASMRRMIDAIARTPRQRTTLYGPVMERIAERKLA
jgi:FO synthase